MERNVKFKIDGVPYFAYEGQYIVEAAKDNGVYIPTLCNIEGVKPRGACRICTVKINGRPQAACTTPIGHGMEIEFNSAELQNFRKTVVEMLFTEGNHYCPTCEKSGNCDLQALGYRFNMMVPRFPYNFPVRNVNATSSKLLIDTNRCIRCKRCIRTIKTEDGKSYFAFYKRGGKVSVKLDEKLGKDISAELAQKAMDICPVGCILVKERGFVVPIGKRKYDYAPIGSEIENNNHKQ